MTRRLLALVFRRRRRCLRREHPGSDGGQATEGEPLQEERLLRRRADDAGAPRGHWCRASGSPSNPPLTTGREPDGPIAGERRAAAHLREGRSAAAHPQAAGDSGESARHHLRHLPRTDRATATASSRARCRCAAAVAAQYVDRPAGYIYEVIDPGLRHDGVVRGRVDRRGALGRRRVRPRAAAQPDHAGRRAAARAVRTQLEALLRVSPRRAGARGPGPQHEEKP